MPTSALRIDLLSVSSCLQSIRWQVAFEMVRVQRLAALRLDLLSFNLLLRTHNDHNGWPLALDSFRRMALWQVEQDGVSFWAA